MTYHIIVNPAGASGNSLKTWNRLEYLFRQDGISYQVHFSSRETGISDLCRILASETEGDTAIVVVGGDGSCNEAINGIRDLSRVIFGFIPAGSGNDLARSLSLPDDPEEIVKLLLEGKIRHTINVGEAVSDAPSPLRRRFLVSCGIGFDAAICHRATGSSLKMFLNRIGFGKLIYITSALHMILTWKMRPLRITYDHSRTVFYPAVLFAVCMNHPYEGGGFKFCPEACNDDDLLDLCIPDSLKALDFYRIFPSAYHGKHIHFSGIHMEKAAHVEISTPQPLWVHTDGEVMGSLNSVQIFLLPEKLRLLL